MIKQGWVINKIKDECIYCNRIVARSQIKKHIKACHKNIANLSECPVCFKIEVKRGNKTCSYACSNTLFRSGENSGTWKGGIAKYYRTICFKYHDKKCVICNEVNIIDVHHLDHNRENNDPANLIPLCPTHHRYWHSEYKHLVEDKILLYVKNYLGVAQ